MDKTGVIHRATPLSQVEAKEMLSNLMSFYTSGHKELLPFHFDFIPDTKKDKENPQGFYESKMESYLIVDRSNPYPDIYVQKAIRAGEFAKEGRFERYEELLELFTDIINNRFEKL